MNYSDLSGAAKGAAILAILSLLFSLNFSSTTTINGVATCSFFDIGKVARVEKVANESDDIVAHAKRSLHARATQVEIAMAQTHRFVNVVFIKLERQRIRRVQNLDLMGHHLDASGRQRVVDGAFGARAHSTFDFKHVLGANSFSGAEGGA